MENRVDCKRGCMMKITGVGLFLTLLLPPGVCRSQDAKLPTKVAPKAGAITPEKDRPAFDLTYVPSCADGVIAIRPNEILRNPAMKPIARMINENPVMLMILFPYTSSIGIPIEEIEQTICYTHTTGSNPEKG